MPVITLTTDFGRKDGYVGAMKGVIFAIAPEARIVDISHDIDPQDVREAAYVLSTAVPYFPPSAIHVVVVDPGVGGGRRPRHTGWRPSAAPFTAGTSSRRWPPTWLPPFPSRRWAHRSRTR